MVIQEVLHHLSIPFIGEAKGVLKGSWRHLYKQRVKLGFQVHTPVMNSKLCIGPLVLRH